MSKITIDDANKVLTTFKSDCYFHHNGRELWISGKYGHRAMRVREHGYPTFDYGRMGWGGTVAMAICELACWIRGRRQYSIKQWDWWCGPQVVLGSDETLRLVNELDALEEHGIGSYQGEREAK